MRKVIIAFLLAGAATPGMVKAQDSGAGAAPLISPLFTDNTILQRDRKDPVWGWAAPGQKVTVTLQGQTRQATADGKGRWMTLVGPFHAGGPYDLTIAGPETRVLKNVSIGDVWVCSGQSNMEFGIGNGLNAPEEIANANYPDIRIFTAQKTVAVSPHDTTVGQWDVCTPSSIMKQGTWNGFSAVAYFFGRELNQKLKVPIGLLQTSWGGTPAEAWTSAEALDVMPDYRTAVAQLRAMQSNQDVNLTPQQRMDVWYAKNDPGSANGIGWADAKTDTAAWKTMALPTAWEAAGLPGFDGVVWFQKSVDVPETAAGKDLVLHLGQIDDRDTTWFNGTRVGGMDQVNLDRVYKIPGDMVKAGQNIIAVRVLDTGGNGGLIGKPEQMHLDIPDGQNISLVGDWKYQVGVDLAKAQPVPMQVDNNPNFPTVLYNGMIAPLVPFGIKGAIWYQGESNAGKAYQYRTLLPTMIQDWRHRWKEGDFPFYIVQLANFTPVNSQPVESDWAELREAQSMTAAHLPNTGIAVIIDIGDAADIHPKDKQDVGKRLALDALAMTYGQKIEYSGPLYRSMKVDGNKIRLVFDHVGGGLVAKGGDKLQGFAIAGADRKFFWVDASIDGASIVVSSPQVDHPVAVRYGWSNNPVVNLYNQEGLPASPFRTDNWPGVTIHNK